MPAVAQFLSGRRAGSADLFFRLMKPSSPESDILHTTLRRGGLSARKQKLVVEFIDAHIAEKISLARLAKLAELSRYHFAHVFKQTFGVPPHRYQAARRMERATDLLLQSTLPVTQVAIRVGFCETSSFTRAYRRYAGVTPSARRRDRRTGPACGCPRR